ncbi:hypothetical protein CRUP_037062 [Coryphaenoides rupestris]|nr:hypothetical protein CRUP_037062 [Coryphaenoides rupestris]
MAPGGHCRSRVASSSSSSSSCPPGPRWSPADTADDDPCPDKCSCDWDAATVWCSDAGLAEVPAGLPPETVALHLEHNAIRLVPEAAFAELLQLARPLPLRLLDLSHNQLRRAGRQDFGATRAKTRLFHNPWHCDCALQELVETLNLEAETVNGIVCESSVRGGGGGSRWEEPPGWQGEHAGQPLVKLLDSGVNFCSLQRKTTDVAIAGDHRSTRRSPAATLEYLKSLPSPRKKTLH